MSELEIIVKGSQIDYELTELLGLKPVDFVVLCFDGEQLDFFGTPYDTPENRTIRQHMVDSLNDKSKHSLWPKMFAEWKAEICKQFKLGTDATAKSFRPVVSLKISRVCHAYSKHIHCAMGLFDILEADIASWSLSKPEDGKARVEIISKAGKRFYRIGDSMPLVIAELIAELKKGQRE